MKEMCRALMYVLAFWTMASVANAQSLDHSLVARGGREWRRDASYIAYLDTVRHVAKIYPDFKGTETLKGECVRLDEWSGVVLFDMGDHCLMGSKSRGIINNEGRSYSIEGQNLLFISHATVHFYGPDFKRIIAYANPPSEQFRWQVADTVGTQRVLCLADYNGKMHLTASELHHWGMLTPAGEWLIPPIYDAPFHFQNGVAEVLYYGQKRKINEQGEFIE